MVSDQAAQSGRQSPWEFGFTTVEPMDSLGALEINERLIEVFEEAGLHVVGYANPAVPDA